MTLKPWLICLLFISTLFHQTKAQDKQRLERAKKYLLDAAIYYGRANYEAAIKEYQFAANIYRNSDDIGNYAKCYNGIGNCYIDLTRYNEAQQEFQRVLSLYREAQLRDSSFKADSNHIADAYEGLGRYYMKVNVNYESALNFHQRALDIRSRIHHSNHPKAALSYYFIGKCYRGFALDSLQNKEDKNTQLGSEVLALEREYLEKALVIQESQIKDSAYLYQLANTLQAIGDYYYVVRKDFQQGYDYQKRALSLRLALYGPGHPQIATSYLDLATYYRAVGAFDEELQHLEKALNIQLSVLGENHQDIAKAYFLLGNRCRSGGDLEKALNHYQRALKIHQNLRTGNSEEVANLYHALGLTHRDLEDADEDYKHLFKALEMRQKIFGAFHFQLSDSYTELGNFYHKEGMSDSMLHYYHLAADILIRQLGQEDYRVAQAYDNLAKAYALKNQDEKALFYLNASLEKKLGQNNNNRQENQQFDNPASGQGPKDDLYRAYILFDSYLNLAKYHKKRQDITQALKQTQQALSTISPSLSGRKALDPYQNPQIEELMHNIDWLEALQLKGELMLLQYQKDKQPKNLAFALTTFEQALSLIDTLRLNFTADASKFQLTKRSIPIFEGKINVLYEYYRQDPKQTQYLDQAFQAVERSKAFVLLQALQNLGSSGSKRDLPKELETQEEYYRRNLSYYADYRNRSLKNAKEFDAAYLKAKQAYDSLITIIERDFPRYYQARHQTTIPELNTLQNDLLGKNDLLLEYFVGDETIYLFAIHKDKKQWLRLPLRKDFSQIIAELYTNLTDYELATKNPSKAYEQFAQKSHAFYDYLVAPALKNLDPKHRGRLIIIPDGPLGYIPFEILVEQNLNNQAPQQPRYGDLPMLLQRFEIYYSYSATLLHRKVFDLRPKNNGLCLAMAPSYLNNNSNPSEQHAELPWAERELQSLSQFFKGEFITGLQATKAQFLQKADQFSILHLATHGTVDLRKSLKSRLAFAQEGPEREAAALYAYEIHDLNLQADLVVLSACETGFGKILRGEGVLSLARAFIYAGSPSVITTLWKVNDYTSATLMGFFYENLAQGMSKSEAMQAAKLRFLSQADHIAGHPVFWASYICIGDPRPLCSPWRWWHYLLLSLGFVATVGFGFYVYQKQKNKLKIS